MAITFPHDCPHCGTKKIGFTAVFNWNSNTDSSQKDVVATCNGCRNGVIFQLILSKQSSEFDFVRDGTGDLKSNGISIKNFYPKLARDEIPTDLPAPVESLYQQALKCIQQQAWDAAGMTLRKVLETSTKTLDSSLSNLNLYNRIEQLNNRGIITAEIKDWAHEIRLDGNDATHEFDLFDQEKAENLKMFVESYLKYVHSMPEAVRRNRARRKA